MEFLEFRPSGGFCESESYRPLFRCLNLAWCKGLSARPVYSPAKHFFGVYTYYVRFFVVNHYVTAVSYPRQQHKRFLLFCVDLNLQRDFNAVAICGANISGGPCEAEAEANGRCHAHGGASTGPKTDAGKARLAQCRSEIAHRRHAALRASGQPARFGALTPERLEAQRAAKAGKTLSTDTKAAIAEGVRAAHAEKRQRRIGTIRNGNIDLDHVYDIARRTHASTRDSIRAAERQEREQRAQARRGNQEPEKARDTILRSMRELKERG